MLTLTFKRALLALAFVASSEARAALTVQTFDGVSSNLPFQLGDATIDFDFTPESSGYYKFGIKTDTGGFGRFDLGSGDCFYWFDFANQSHIDEMTTNRLGIYDTAYSYAGNTELSASLVDGANWGDDNYISYFDASNRLVAVLRIGFTEGLEEARLLGAAYDPDGLTEQPCFLETFGEARLLGAAYDPDGLTFSAGMAALPVPEPSSALLFGLGAISAAFLRRRRA